MMIYASLKNSCWQTQAYCCLNKQHTAFSHCPASLSAVSFLFHIYSALVYFTATAVLSFKPSAIKQQKIPYPISSWLQLSAAVIPLLCTRLSELPLPLYERALGGKWASVLSTLTFLRGKTLPLCGEVSVVEPDLKTQLEPSVSDFDASLLLISISHSLIRFSSNGFLLCHLLSPCFTGTVNVSAPHIKL